MNRFLTPAVLFTLLVVVLVVAVRRAPEKSTIQSVLIGKAAPTFALAELTRPDHVVDSKSLLGRWYAFNVWGTWCVECRVEHEALLAIKRDGRVPLIGMDWKDEDAAATQWLSELGNPYATVVVDRNGRVALDWGVYGAPETFLVSPLGIIVYKHVGAMTAGVWQQQFLTRASAPTLTQDLAAGARK